MECSSNAANSLSLIEQKNDSASIINESGVVLLVEDSKPPANDAVDQMMDFYSGADEPSCPHQLQVENVFSTRLSCLIQQITNVCCFTKLIIV